MAMNSRTEFPKRLRKVREEFNYTPKEFAKYLDINLQSYYTYERGQAVPSFDVLMHIAEKCNISLDWLCGIAATQTFTKEKMDVSTVLSQLLTASEMGKHIEVHITCD